MKKGTAVEWLALYIKGITTLNCDEVIAKAKAIEKVQISEAYTTGVEEDVYSNPLRTGEMYYNDTYL